jgi:hypothetical protein
VVNADGDAVQQTTTGRAYYRKSTNLASFSTGNDHWVVVPTGLDHWTGPSDEPPGGLLDDPPAPDAQPVPDD